MTVIGRITLEKRISNPRFQAKIRHFKHWHALCLLYKRKLKKNEKVKNEKEKKNNNYALKVFHGGGKSRQLLCFNDKIAIPKTLEDKVVEWYHSTLCHPGRDRTEQTIRQHFWWPKLSEQVRSKCARCHICQQNKRSGTKYGILPEKEAECIPWDRLCVGDLIGPYTIDREDNDEPLTLWCVTMIDPATGWFEIKEIKEKSADYIANLVELTWITRYPTPDIVVYDRGTKFMAEFAKMMGEDYGIKTKSITVRNPQANAIIERVHATIGNMLRTFKYEDLDQEDPWSGILAAVMFATRATYHTTLGATPAQLVFGRDAILNTKFEANWNHIKQRKQEIIKKNNADRKSVV